MRDDQDLRIARERLDQLQEAVEVHVVERRLHLVEQIERTRTSTEDREQEGHRGERALAPGQQRDATHTLAAGTRLDLQPRLEEVRRVRQDELPFAAGEQLLEQVGERLRHVGERGVERRGDLHVDPLDQLEEIAARGFHVVELPRHEVVALLHGLELPGREEVHPAEQPQPAGDELRAPLQRLDVLLLAQGRDGLRRIAAVSGAEQRLGIRDPAVEVAARAVLVRVVLP